MKQPLSAVGPMAAVASELSTRRGLPDSSLKLWVVLARAYAAIARRADADIARHGLTTTEFGILEALHHKGPLLLGEIQKKILVTSGGITYLVDRLVDKGLVVRQACPEDRRARYAVLTPKGKALIADIFPDHAACIARAMEGLEPHERLEAAALLRRLGRTAESLRIDDPAVSPPSQAPGGGTSRAARPSSAPRSATAS